MRRQRTFRDPTADRADISDLGPILGGLDDTEAAVFLTVFVLEWPLTQAARLMRRSEDAVGRTLEKVVRQLRHPGYWQSLSSEYDGGRISVSAEVRPWVRELCEAAVRRCPQCQEPYLSQQLTSSSEGGRSGRPRKFCSNACRQAAYRKRRAVAPPEPGTATAPPPRLPGRPQVHHLRPAICTEYTNYEPESGGRLLLRCFLFRGHGGLHCALAAVPEEECLYLFPAWIRWECGTAQSVTEYACSGCALPTGHTGACVRDSRLWSMPYASESTALPMDREMLRAVRVRLSFPSPEVAVPMWRRVG